MKYGIGKKVKVITLYYSKTNLKQGDIVTIVNYEHMPTIDCYKCVKNNEYYYLFEDEVEPLSNGDRIRAMNDKQLINFIKEIRNGYSFGDNIEGWIKQNEI